MTETKNHDTEVTKFEAASLLDVSLRTVDRYISRGDLTPIKYRNKRVKVARSQVIALLQPVTDDALATPTDSAAGSTPTAPPSGEPAAVTPEAVAS